MKMWKKIMTSVLTAGLLFSMSLVNVFAAPAEEYTYTATFYAGNQGIFNGTNGLTVDNALSGSSYSITPDRDGSRIVVSGLKFGDAVSFNIQAGSISLENGGKYYVKGVRPSGRDNNEPVESSAFHVTEDKDFVIAYGIKGETTSYTVNYLDAQGNELAPSQTYYGNVGDKPVVAYLYIENYTPQALGLTKTLTSNEADNVFDFIYTPVETQVITDVTVVPGTTTTTTTTVPGTTDTTGTPGTAGTDAAGTTGTDNTAAGTAGTETGTAGENAGTGDGTEVISPEEVPEGNPDVVDLDEDETPLAKDADLSKEKVKKGLPLAAGIAIAVGAVSALSVLAVFLIKRRRGR